jgi:hypothetical protein
VRGFRCLLSLALLLDCCISKMLEHVSHWASWLTESEGTAPVKVTEVKLHLNTFLYHMVHIISCYLIQDRGAEIGVVPCFKSLLCQACASHMLFTSGFRGSACLSNTDLPNWPTLRFKHRLLAVMCVCVCVRVGARAHARVCVWAGRSGHTVASLLWCWRQRWSLKHQWFLTSWCIR